MPKVHNIMVRKSCKFCDFVIVIKKTYNIF